MLNHSPKQPCNHLGGKKWIKYSISIWDDLQKSREEQQLQHPAIFPVSLAKRVVEVWSREGELVFDPFVGSGSTLIAAAQLKRRGLGIDLSPEYIELAQKRLLELKGALPWKLYRDDALNLSRYLQEESADLCLTSPPYWDILQARRTADHKVSRHYGHREHDLGNIREYELYLEKINKIFAEVFTALKKGKYCIVVVMDLRKKSKFYPLHLDLTLIMQKIGFLLDDIIIWDRRRDYNFLRPLGYPYVFRVNKVHEYLLIFQKPKAKK